MVTISRSSRRGIVLMNCMASMGDSMTWRPSVANSYPTLIGAARNFAHVLNAGIDGDLSTEMADRFDADILSWRPGVVSIMCGTNDAGLSTPTGTFEAAVRGMIAKAQALGAKVTLCTPPIVRVDARPMETYNNILRAIAADTAGVVLFDVYARFATYNSTTLNLYYEVDGTHLKLAGNQAIRDLANEAGNLAAFRAAN
jgi:lysophospholipase L1-like esterase